MAQLRDSTIETGAKRAPGFDETTRDKDMTTTQAKALINRLKIRSENAYNDYIAHSSHQECLGWEAKVENGAFGWRELEAHTKRGEFLGRHRALREAMLLVEDELKSAEENTITTCPNCRSDRLTTPLHKPLEVKCGGCGFEFILPSRENKP